MVHFELPVSEQGAKKDGRNFNHRNAIACGFAALLILSNGTAGSCLSMDEHIEPPVQSLLSSPESGVVLPQSINGDEEQDEFDIFDRPVSQLDTVKKKNVELLSPQAKELLADMGLQREFDRLKKSHQDFLKHKTEAARMNSVIIQFQISRALLRASLQMQDTFANIDGDLAQTNMLLAYASTKHERELLLNNVATFTGVGTFGLLDASTRLGHLSPTSDIFGILSSATAIILPLISLRTPKYSNPRRSQPRVNMLNPLFDPSSEGDGYQPIVWHYINSVPANSKNNKTRRDMLVESWKAYRGFGKETGAKKIETIENIINAPSKQNQLTLDALKTRAELLIDVRALIQSMYRSLAEIDGASSLL